MIDNYFNLRNKARKLKDRYKELTIEEKVNLILIWYYIRNIVTE